MAIAILLISIAGPLTVAEKALTEAVSSQDQLTASYLAQDLMEFVKNVRDDNIMNEGNNGWLNNIGFNSSTGQNSCAPGGTTPCDFDTEVENAATLNTISSCTPVTVTIGTGSGTQEKLCQIYLDTITPSGGSSVSYYTPSSGSQTKFSRAFTITPIPTSVLNANATSSVVTVTVAWKTGGVSNYVSIQDIIFNTSR